MQVFKIIEGASSKCWWSSFFFEADQVLILLQAFFNLNEAISKPDRDVISSGMIDCFSEKK